MYCRDCALWGAPLRSCTVRRSPAPAARGRALADGRALGARGRARDATRRRQAPIGMPYFHIFVRTFTAPCCVSCALIKLIMFMI